MLDGGGFQAIGDLPNKNPNPSPPPPFLAPHQYDLYVDPAKEELKDKFWDKRVSLGAVRRDEDE